ncbi:MAG: tRNA 2-thiouridine(34) synthase MnmA [Patescibacteria group bacterium]|nr:tRNA 2-thiouridine(34) synthase MnmA [Patescibacteria group bacterium]
MFKNLFKSSQLPKVAVGLSGGVDSALATHLLKEQGYAVTGVYLQCWNEPGCTADQGHKDALKVALDLKIPFKVLDFSKEYKAKVIDHFFKEYQAGRTPNPDILCNRDIKFGLFYDWAIKKGFAYVATGHYAKILANKKNNNHQLVIPKDEHKDQTYFLYLMKSERLPHILFPLADLTKAQVRTEAKQRQIHVADKKDSVGICFIGDVDVSKMLKEKLGEHPGDVVDTEGQVIGEHQGLWFYTIGQRSGFTIHQTTLAGKSDGQTITKHHIPPFFVIDKLIDKNQLVVGFGATTLRDQFQVTSLHWINQSPEKTDLMVRIRHTGELIKCHIKMNAEINTALVKLEKPIKGLASGQSAVFYQTQSGETVCLGGGVIK